MKRKEAIKQTQEGKAQVFNDYHPSTKEIKKFLKEAFPEDDYLEKYPNEVDEISRRYFQKASYDKDYWVSSNGWKKSLPIINLSTITKRKKTKLIQLEQQFSELSKDVAELRQSLAKDVEVVAEEVKSELVVGEWYKGIARIKKETPFRYIYALEINEEKVIGYGCNGYGEYENKYSVYNKKELKRATPQEVETALVNEAKKRGFENGAIINNSSIGFGFNELYLDTNLFEWDGTYLNIGKEKLAIFKDGIWAEIKETIKEEVIDWDVPQLLRTECGKVVLSNGKHNSFSFVGNVVVSTLKSQPVGHFAKNWTKKAFKPTKLTIEESL